MDFGLSVYERLEGGLGIIFPNCSNIAVQRAASCKISGKFFSKAYIICLYVLLIRFAYTFYMQCIYTRTGAPLSGSLDVLTLHPRVRVFLLLFDFLPPMVLVLHGGV